ncbi:hypothetical protein [Algoriphagus sp. PAP.12]|uniref:hypothetical protein n=1 Tax=Algoriphagus sp. PAP.12 TaxID=2996678 RepID=UPI00227CCA3D|nr:hypothetical protein [Algoriphagus sp. PAP.12]
MKYFVSFLLLTFSFSAFSQIEVTSERDDKGEVTLNYVNSSEMTYTVLLEFPVLLNLSTTGGSRVIAIANPGKGRLTTLKPLQSNQRTNYSYKYTFVKGNIYGKTKVEPIYLVPVKEGTTVRSVPMTHLENRLQPKEHNDEYVGISFHFDEEVEIVAPRKGIVAGLSMSNDKSSENLDFTRSENFIEIYHEDGKVTKIMVLKSGSQQVQLGQEVFPGDVLATSAGDNYQGGKHVRMAVMEVVKNEEGLIKNKIIPVNFAINGESVLLENYGPFEVIFPEEVITREMTKKELKNYGKE